MITTALSAHPSPPSLQTRVPPKPSISAPSPVSLASPQASSHERLLHAPGSRSLSPPASQPWNPLFNPRKVRRSAVGVRFSLDQIPGPEEVEAAIDVLSQVPDKAQGLMLRVESALYTLADAAVATDAVTGQKQDGGWLGGLTDALESILKVLKDGFSALHVPYAYGFAIILLTIIVKAATFPLTKKQVESTLAMQNLSPKIKAIQQRYAGDQERIQLETARLYKQAGVNPLAGCLPTLATIPVFIGLYRALSNVANEGLLTEGFFWIPSLAGPTTIVARQNGTGISWLFPFIDGHPPLGWSDTLAYLVLPVLLVASQYISMQLMQTPQMDDPSQKNTQLLLKFLPLMIGYFSLSVPSGLSLYWMTNNILSTGQQVWLRRLGGAKPVVGKDGDGIISAGQALRSSSPAPVVDLKEQRRGERFRQLKSEEVKKKGEQAGVARRAEVVASTTATLSSESDEEEERGEQGGEDGSISLASAKDTLEEMYSKTSNRVPGPGASSPKRSKRSKRRRSV